jgi:hypothetical protein
MIIIDEKFLVIKEINGYLVDMILINSFRSGLDITYAMLQIKRSRSYQISGREPYNLPICSQYNAIHALNATGGLIHFAPLSQIIKIDLLSKQKHEINRIFMQFLWQKITLELSEIKKPKTQFSGSSFCSMNYFWSHPKK